MAEMTHQEAYDQLKRPGWPDSAAQALAHPIFGRLMKFRIASAHALEVKPKIRNHISPNDFDWKAKQSRNDE
jgi:hypothetical protein